MNETITNLISRRSVRSFQPKQITKEELDLILKAGQYAPTGMDRQPLLFAAVQDKDLIAKLSKMNAAVMGKDVDPFYGAPTVVLVLVKAGIGTGVEDGALAMGNLMNAAQSLGIGSCWIHRELEIFESEEGKALLKEWGVTEEYRGVGACILGYPATQPAKASERKSKILYL